MSRRIPSVRPGWPCQRSFSLIAPPGFSSFGLSRVPPGVLASRGLLGSKTRKDPSSRKYSAGFRGCSPVWVSSQVPPSSARAFFRVFPARRASAHEPRRDVLAARSGSPVSAHHARSNAVVLPEPFGPVSTFILGAGLRSSSGNGPRFPARMRRMGLACFLSRLSEASGLSANFSSPLVSRPGLPGGFSRWVRPGGCAPAGDLRRTPSRRRRSGAPGRVSAPRRGRRSPGTAPGCRPRSGTCRPWSVGLFK